MIRVFICTELFERSLQTRENFGEIQELIEARLRKDIECGDLVPGTGGVRKFRLEVLNKNKGKRGGFRILYIDLPHVECTYFLLMYHKNEISNPTTAQKKIIKSMVDRLKKENL